MNLTLKEYLNKIQNWELKAEEVVNSYLNKAKQLNPNLNAYLRFHDDYIEKNISEFKNRPLKAAPIAIKDIILTKGYVSSCASKMLEDYVPPYSATCFQNLENAWWLMIGKANMDEFAMGWSWEKSAFGPTKNPHGTNRVSGWSSSGSASAVAADLCIAALWTDTWWSIRQPASLCWVVWIKPTYGRVSRFGVQAMASSLDQVWVFTKTVEDSKILLQSISGHDDNDATSIKIDDYKKWDEALEVKDLKNFKIAVPKQYFEEGIDENVKKVILESIEKAKSLGAQVDWIDMPILKYALAVYYIVVPAEVSTNLSRFDGIRFGYQEDTFDYDKIYEYYASIRAKGFGDEAKRRIMIWTYVLSAWYYDAYYVRAQKVRKKIKMEFDRVFADYDLIVWPVSPTVAWKIWQIIDDPIKDYLADIYTISVNLAWLPGMSLPVGFAEDQWENMPVWLHIVSNQWNEDKIFAFANVMEKNLK